MKNITSFIFGLSCSITTVLGIILILVFDTVDTNFTYRISSFKRRSVHLILGVLGVAFIRGRRLIQKSK